MPKCNHIYHWKDIYMYRPSRNPNKKLIKVEVIRGINPVKPNSAEICDEGLIEKK